MKQAALEYRQEHFDHGEMDIHGDGGLDYAATYEDWLEKINADLTYMADESRVPASIWFAVAGNEIVGIIQVRHVLNDHLRNDGGHVGYGVRPSARQRGYATRMLALALEKCRVLGIDKAMLTCIKANIGSAQTIINNGGVLDSEFLDANGDLCQRYWISIAL